LLGSRVDRHGCLIIAWYGPSGLSSLLLILLAVFAGLPGSERLFAICSLIVLISIVLHGFSPTLLARLMKKYEPETKPEELPPTAEVPKEASRSLRVVESPSPIGKQIITLEELDGLQNSGEKVILLDVRTERSRETSDTQAESSIRMPPENVAQQARELKLPKDAWLIAYCA
jgi:sodium/hydrogen antiporter